MILLAPHTHHRRLLTQGHERLGYDVGTVASVGLLASAGPAAWATGGSCRRERHTFYSTVACCCVPCELVCGYEGSRFVWDAGFCAHWFSLVARVT